MSRVQIIPLHPKDPEEVFEYLERCETKIYYSEDTKNLTIILMLKSEATELEVVETKERLKKIVLYDPDQFFIGTYN